MKGSINVKNKDIKCFYHSYLLHIQKVETVIYQPPVGNCKEYEWKIKYTVVHSPVIIKLSKVEKE